MLRDRRARWDNGACGSSTGSSAPIFSRGFRSSPASIACTMPPARCSTSAKREASVALMRLLRFVAHPTARRRRDRLSVPRYSRVYTFRRLPREWPELWRALLRGTSREALEQLCLSLLEHDAARARGAEIHADLRAVERF